MYLTRTNLRINAVQI